MVDQLPSVTGDAGAEEATPVVLFKSVQAGGGPLDFSAPTNVASGVTPVTGTFSATGQSGTFTPIAGRDFNVFVAATSNTTQLERQRDGSTWEVVLTSALLTALPPSFTWSEPQYGVPYRLNCTAYVASQAYGLSQ